MGGAEGTQWCTPTCTCALRLTQSLSDLTCPQKSEQTCAAAVGHQDGHILCPL